MSGLEHSPVPLKVLSSNTTTCIFRYQPSPKAEAPWFEELHHAGDGQMAHMVRRLVKSLHSCEFKSCSTLFDVN